MSLEQNSFFYGKLGIGNGELGILNGERRFASMPLLVGLLQPYGLPLDDMTVHRGNPLLQPFRCSSFCAQKLEHRKRRWHCRFA